MGHFYSNFNVKCPFCYHYAFWHFLTMRGVQERDLMVNVSFEKYIDAETRFAAFFNPKPYALFI